MCISLPTHSNPIHISSKNSPTCILGEKQGNHSSIVYNFKRYRNHSDVHQQENEHYLYSVEYSTSAKITNELELHLPAR